MLGSGGSLAVPVVLLLRNMDCFPNHSFSHKHPVDSASMEQQVLCPTVCRSEHVTFPWCGRPRRASWFLVLSLLYRSILLLSLLYLYLEHPPPSYPFSSSPLSLLYRRGIIIYRACIYQFRLFYILLRAATVCMQPVQSLLIVR